MDKNIELELRAEVDVAFFEDLLSKFKDLGQLKSITKRLSVMYFGTIDGAPFDIRVRITNGECEVVIKKGDLHAHNRVEVSQSIQHDQFLGMVRLMMLFGFEAEVGQRETYNFGFENEITVSLVKAGEIAYVEFEKMTDREHEEDERINLEKLVSTLNMKLINSREEFDALCKRLSDTVDWKFLGSEDHYNRLSELLANHSI